MASSCIPSLLLTLITSIMIGSILAVCPSNYADKNCLQCTNDTPPKCQLCYTHFKLAENNVCGKDCKVRNCIDCKVGDSYKCNSCSEGYQLQTRGGFTAVSNGQMVWNPENSECHSISLGASQSLLVYVNLIMIIATIGIGVFCWKTTHREQLIRYHHHQDFCNSPEEVTEIDHGIELNNDNSSVDDMRTS